jgi:hypothetical protein
MKAARILNFNSFKKDRLSQQDFPEELTLKESDPYYKEMLRLKSIN